MSDTTKQLVDLRGFAKLSMVAALATIGLKFYAWHITGSTGLFSDALESVVNLLSAGTALWALTVSALPPDEEHAYGHAKAEYFSSGIEGGLIILAAGLILFTAVPRLFNPHELASLDRGLILSTLASLINGGVALCLLRAGKRHASIVLEADGKHLLTDVWTSVGVIGAIFLVKISGWTILDPLVAIVVALNIIYMGFSLVRRSANGLMDYVLPTNEVAKIVAILDGITGSHGAQYHALRTRSAGRQRFISVHILVPGMWSVQKGHDLLEDLEQEIRAAFDEGTHIFTHLEPLDDPRSFMDTLIIEVDT